MPAGAVQHHDGVCAGRHGGGEVDQEAVHGLGADPRQHEREILAGRGSQGREDVGRGKAPVAQARRALPPHPLAMARSALLADARLIHEPERDRLVRRLCFGVELGFFRTFDAHYVGFCFLYVCCASAT